MHKRLQILLSILFINWVYSFGQQNKPFYYLNFDDKNSKQQLDSNSYQCSYSIISRGNGQAVDMKKKDCLLVAQGFKNTVIDEFSMEFLFKGSSLFFLTFPQQSMVVRFGYEGILFQTTIQSSSGNSEADELVVTLNGAGKKSYNYYTDGNWHHMVFTASIKKGRKEVWIDGECPDGFSKPISAKGKFEFGYGNGFRNTDCIDELALYNTMLSPELIRQHFNEIKEGKSYTFSLSHTGTLNAAARQSKKTEPGIDILEFAPGYPDYTIQATDQLKSFPLPRYNELVKFKRNMSWMDISYLHRELPGNGGKGFGKQNPAKAVALEKEMAENWNYYLDIPTSRTDASTAQKLYADTSKFTGALVSFARKNTIYPWATILIEAQNNPAHANFNRSGAYILASDLSAEYYFKDVNDVPVIYNKRKWLSPLMPLDVVIKDAKTSRFYLDQVLKFISSPPSLINENGETFGHMRPEDLLQKDPSVWKDYKNSGLTVSEYSGKFLYRLDSAYKTTIMRGLDPQKTHFSFYNVSAFNAEYWPDYLMRREVNRWDKNSVLPTPDFYPRWPNNWRYAMGAYNGYATVAKGRVKEISVGDKSFSPFVGAGWGEEEANIRPAQWLALLKAMVMLGADFFYTGYFNVTGAGGKWPNGFGPYDPRGYAYQIAMPAYAQAIRTWVPVFFEKGELLNPADSNDVIHQFRFNTGSENELVLVRKIGKKFLIYGSIQPNSNIKGNVPQSKITTLELDGEKIKLEIRRQGSVYILDKSQRDPVFYQLDGWHQYEHPSYWSKIYFVEAEAINENIEAARFPVITESNSGNKNDFSDYFSYIRLSNGKTFNLRLALRNNTRYTVSARVRSAGKTSLKLNLEQGKESKLNVSGSGWKMVSSQTFSLSSAETLKECMLTFQTTGASLDIDWIKVTPVE